MKMDPPVKPEESDCCNSGCNPCILDVYQMQLKKYEDYLKNVHIDESNSQSFKNCICSTSYSVFKLVGYEKHTRDSYFYTFQSSQLQNESVETKKCLRYKPGQYFLLKAYDASSEKEFTRAYTPIPHEKNDSSTFTILVRLYGLGKMCSYIRNLNIGDETHWRGPYCDFLIDYSFKNILFIAQGTGIAPIYSIIDNILWNDNCETFLYLFFCCRSAEDILIRDELHKFKLHWNFQYEIFLSNSSDINKKYNEIVHERRLEKCDIEEFIERKKKDNSQFLICGSEHFENGIKDYLKDCGVTKEVIYIF